MKVFPSLLFKRLVLSALLLLCLPLHIAPGVAYEDLWPKCDTCLADSVREAAGVGFELTTSYAYVPNAFRAPWWPCLLTDWEELHPFAITMAQHWM